MERRRERSFDESIALAASGGRKLSELLSSALVESESAGVSQVLSIALVKVAGSASECVAERYAGADPGGG